MDWFDWFFGKQMFCPSFPSNLVTRVFRSREPVLPCAATFQSPTDSHRFGWIGDEGKGPGLGGVEVLELYLDLQGVSNGGPLVV